MTEHQGDGPEGPGWDAIASLEAVEARDATEGWTQEIIPSAVVQQAQLEADRERDTWHEMTGPGYTEPPLDWYPDPDPAVEAARTRRSPS
jgi:hypothetical protein